MDFGSMNMKQLKTLLRSVEKEIERRDNTDRKKAIDEIRALAKARGLKLEDLQEKSAGRRAPKTSKSDTEGKVKTKRAPAKIKYRNPDNSALTWTGRGRQPKWIAEWVATGKTLEALAV